MDRRDRLPPVWGTGGKVTLAAHRDHGTESVRVLSHSWLSLPVLTGPWTTRGVPQLAPEAFKCVGSLQEPEGSKCFLQEPQGAKGGEGKGRGGNAALGPLPLKCPLPTWLFCVQHFISLAHRQSPLQNPPSRKLHRQYSHCQQPSLPTETCLAVPRSRSQGRRRRREGRCTARAGNLSTPPSQSKSQALPCSHSVLPATGWPAGRAVVCGEHEPAPSNELHGKQTLPMQD